MHIQFTLKDSDKMIQDVIDEFFESQNDTYNQKDLLKNSLTGGAVPAGYHRMPDNSLMLNEEMV